LTTCYLDASAIVKLAIIESETDALREHVGQYDIRVSSRLVSVEVPRALARRGQDSVEVAAESLAEILETLNFMELDLAVARQAAILQPATLRALDAIHLASAQALGDDLTALITYDTRLASAARAVGLTVLAPA
jgi:predicted nucleic acid-binding protein